MGQLIRWSDISLLFKKIFIYLPVCLCVYTCDYPHSDTYSVNGNDDDDYDYNINNQDNNSNNVKKIMMIIVLTIKLRQ